MKKPEIPLDQKLLLSVLDVCALADVGHTQARAAIKSGELKARKRGRSTIILRDDLHEWIASFPAYTPDQMQVNTRPRQRRALVAAASAPPNKRAAAAGRKTAVADRANQGRGALVAAE
jgi:hypothetical protein